MRSIIASLFFLAALFAAGENANRRAPGFALPDSKMEIHDLADYRGKLVILEFMQTTCPHCARLADILETVHGKYGDKVAILSIAVPPDTQSSVARFVGLHKISTPVLFDCGQASASYLMATPQNPKIDIPHLFLIDGQGMIRNDFVYGFDTKNIFEGDGLDTEIDHLLAGSAPAKSKK
jgi:peroxiredoxin